MQPQSRPILLWTDIMLFVEGSFSRFRIFTAFPLKSRLRKIFIDPQEKKVLTEERKRKNIGGLTKPWKKNLFHCVHFIRPLRVWMLRRHLKVEKIVSFNWKYFVERFPLECSGHLNNNRYPKHPRSHSTSIRAQSLSRAFNWKKLFDV